VQGGFLFVLLMLRCVGRDWHKADIRGTATFCPLSDKSGHFSPSTCIMLVG
jgi:hypothetical protein